MLAGLALLSPSASFAQSTGTGTISGRIINASTGTYMPNVVVRVPGTNLSTTTNNEGVYTLRNVPSGAANVQVEYVGLEDITASIDVSAGSSVKKDFQLGRSSGQTDSDGTILLDEFVVASDRFKNAAEIAINAERQSINIKNVVSTEEFGEIPGGNVGEFIKFLPGVELEYGAEYVNPTDASGISIRGFGPEDTDIMIDGVPVTAASSGSLTNQVYLDMLSINNASRVELIKVPTPDMPMNSVGGQINLISKSAFEYAKPSFRYKTYVVINSENPNPFDKVIGPTPKRVYAGQPGFEMTYIKPINEKLGLTITGSRFSQFSANNRMQSTYQTDPNGAKLDLRNYGGERNTLPSNSNGVLSETDPVLLRATATDSPRTSTSTSGSMKLDWKPFDGLSIASNYQYSQYEAKDNDRRIDYRMRYPDDWGPDYAYSIPYITADQSPVGKSYNPNNSVSQTITTRDKEGTTHSAYIKANYRKGGWDISALANFSKSRASFVDEKNGHFSGLDLSASVGTLHFDDIVDGAPGRVTAYTRDGLELVPYDTTDLSKWNPEIKAKSGEAESEDKNTLYQFDVRRELDFLPTDAVRLSVKAGVRYDERVKRKWGRGTGYRESYVGPSFDVTSIVDTTYTKEFGWGLPPQQFASTYKLFDLAQANPDYFEVLPGDEDDNYYSSIGQNKSITEKKEAWYAQIEGSALDDRLHFVAGLRNETNTREGYGPFGDGRWNYLKNPDGTLYRNDLSERWSKIVRIEKPDAILFAQTPEGDAVRADLTAKGIPFPTSPIDKSSLEGAMLQRQTREFTGGSSGDPNYSINVSYDITKNLVAKLAYSRTSGRIKIEDSTRGLLSGNQNDFKITEEEDTSKIPAGTISIANPNLLPESSQNWDFELSYYSPRGGKLSGSYYLKQIKNFTENYEFFSGDPQFDAILGGLELDPVDFPDWVVKTSDNGTGTGEAWGYELQASQDLRILPFLGDAGRNIRFFATYSYRERPESKDPNIVNRISARPSAKVLSSGGVNISMKRFNVNIKAAYNDDVYKGRGSSYKIDNGDGTTSTVDIDKFTPGGWRVDVSGSYQINPDYSVYVSARNVFEQGLGEQRWDPLGRYPEYAYWTDRRETGVQITLGLNGKF